MLNKDDTGKVDKPAEDSDSDKVNKVTKINISHTEKQSKKKKTDSALENKTDSTIENESVNEPTISKSDLIKSKTVPASRRGKRKGSKEIPVAEKKIKDDSEKIDIQEEEKEKEPTAQEKLHMKLTQRKKEARLKSLKDNKKSKKKS